MADEPAETPVADPADEPVVTSLDWQGHRGARGLRPENTLPGFELALDLGVDTLELDLHWAADDVVVVWHDPVVEPTLCSGEGVSMPIRQLTSTQLRALRCDRNPDPGRFPEQAAQPGTLAGDDWGIVGLAELFGFVAGYAGSEAKTPEQRANAETVRFNVETKRKPDDPGAIGDGFDGETAGPFERAIIAAIGDAGLTDRVSIQSFDHRSLWAVRAETPAIDLVALTGGGVPDFAELARRGAGTWSPDQRSVTDAAVSAAHGAGLLVVPWTVNDPAAMDRLIELGVDGIITDRPDLQPSGS